MGRAGVAAVVAIVFATVGWRVPAMVAGIAACLLAISALVAPRLIARFEGALLPVGRALARVLAWLLLVPVFVLVVLPLGLVRRRTDPLRLRRDPDAPTFWSERDPSGFGSERAY